MTHKWLSSDYDMAEERLSDDFLTGESFRKWDIAKILDGYPVDDLILASAKQDSDEVKRILKSHVDRFLQTEEGQRLIDDKVYEIRIDREAAHVDHLIKQRKEAFA